VLLDGKWDRGEEKKMKKSDGRRKKLIAAFCSAINDEGLEGRKRNI